MLKLPARGDLPRLGTAIPMPGWKKVLDAWEERGFSRGDFKPLLRERLKSHPLYRLPVEVEPPVTGRTNEGVPIPINSLGRWLFGVPGYAGNILCDPFAEVPTVYVSTSAPKEAIELIASAAEVDSLD